MGVQLAFLSIGERTQHLNHFHYYVDHVLKLGFIISQTIALAKHLGGFLNILITHNNCFPKCCEVVTTLHEQFGQVEGLWFDSHIAMVAIFIQPQLTTWQRFVPQSFVTSSVISVVSGAYTPASVQKSFLFWTSSYYFLLLGWPAVIMVRLWVNWIKILTNQLFTVMGIYYFFVETWIICRIYPYIMLLRGPTV